ncbi:transposase, partial [Thiolapillus sp.]
MGLLDDGRPLNQGKSHFVFPLAQGTPGKQCGLAATGVYQPSLRSPWLAANDHDDLRKDSTLALLVGKRDLTGERRVREQDLGNPLAASSTLNRLELGTPESASSDRYKRITADSEALDRLLVDLFLESYRKPPRKVWLDLDATDDPLHGQQEGRFFHGYYRCYCYLPLYIFSGEHLLCARLRTADK